MNDEQTRKCDVGKCLSSLRHFFLVGLRDTRPFDSPVIKAAKSGMTKSNREVRTEKVKRMRLPTPYFFIAWMRHMYWEGGILDSKMTYLGTALAYNYGMRSNEYCHDDKGKGASAIRGKDFFFVTKAGDRYLASDTRIRGLPASDVTMSVGEVNAGKTLSEGRTRKLFLAREASAIEGQLLEDLFVFCKEAELRPDDLLMSRYLNGRNKRLTPKMVSSVLKAAAAEFGLPESMFSTHCNRIGCATDLIAYGYEDEDLCRFIGWRSDSSLLYQLPSRHDPSALRAGAEGGTLTLSDVANLVPAARSEELEVARERARVRAQVA